MQPTSAPKPPPGHVPHALAKLLANSKYFIRDADGNLVEVDKPTYDAAVVEASRRSAP